MPSDVRRDTGVGRGEGNARGARFGGAELHHHLCAGAATLREEKSCRLCRHRTREPGVLNTADVCTRRASRLATVLAVAVVPGRVPIAATILGLFPRG